MTVYPHIDVRILLAAHLCGAVMGMATIVAMVPGMVQLMRAFNS